MKNLENKKLTLFDTKLSNLCATNLFLGRFWIQKCEVKGFSVCSHSTHRVLMVSNAPQKTSARSGVHPPKDGNYAPETEILPPKLKMQLKFTFHTHSQRIFKNQIFQKLHTWQLACFILAIESQLQPINSFVRFQQGKVEKMQFQWMIWPFWNEVTYFSVYRMIQNNSLSRN